jgi:prefoldin subunit 5
MNNEQRKRLTDIQNQIVSFDDSIDTLRLELEDLMDEERNKFDNLPEGLQQSEKGEKIDECATTLESAMDELESAIDSLKSAFDLIEEAKN